MAPGLGYAGKTPMPNQWSDPAIPRYKVLKAIRLREEEAIALALLSNILGKSESEVIRMGLTGEIPRAARMAVARLRRAETTLKAADKASDDDLLAAAVGLQSLDDMGTELNRHADEMLRAIQRVRDKRRGR